MPWGARFISRKSMRIWGQKRLSFFQYHVSRLPWPLILDRPFRRPPTRTIGPYSHDRSLLSICLPDKLFFATFEFFDSLIEHGFHLGCASATREIARRDLFPRLRIEHLRSHILTLDSATLSERSIHFPVSMPIFPSILVSFKNGRSLIIFRWGTPGPIRPPSMSFINQLT
jgi:hypothetical protein